MMPTPPVTAALFGPLDWAIVVVYGLVLIAIGTFYARKPQTTESYFVASRSVSPFMAGISLCATMLSTVSYIAVPGEMIQNGPVMACLYIAALPITYLIAGWLIIPAIMKLRITSAYELLQERLGLPVRLFGSGIFIVTRLVWLGLILFTTSKIVVTVLGWPESWGFWVAVVCGGLTTVYTVTGGISAVLLTDVIQFFILLAGALLALICITLGVGGVDAWWPQSWHAHWSTQPAFSLDPHVRVTMFGTLLGTVIWWVCTSGSDQMAIQRYLTTPDARAARRAFLLNNIADTTVTCLLGLVGLALIAFFQRNPGQLPAGVTLEKNGDSIFLAYIAQFLPLGVPGLVVSGLLAAAMSSFSSGINGIIAVFSKDFLQTFWPRTAQSEKRQLRSAYLSAAVVGTLGILGSKAMTSVPGNLLEVAFKTTNLFLCPLFGLFFLALFIRFATPFGAIMGALYSFASAVLVGYWDVITGQPGLSFQWISPVSLAVSLAGGVLFSLVPTPRAPSGVLLAWSAVFIAPLAGVFWWACT